MFRIGTLQSAGSWNGRTWPFSPVQPYEYIDVVMYPAFEPASDPVEVYSGTRRLILPSALHRGVAGTGECPHDELRYDVRGLGAGEYLVVHRRSSAPGNYRPGFEMVDWTTFEGEQAVVTTLVVGPPSLDAGAP